MSVVVFPYGMRALFHRDGAQPSDHARTDPPAPKRASPVFIHDAVTPWRGETWLSARLKADLAMLDQDTE